MRERDLPRSPDSARPVRQRHGGHTLRWLHPVDSRRSTDSDSIMSPGAVAQMLLHQLMDLREELASFKNFLNTFVKYYEYTLFYIAHVASSLPALLHKQVDSNSLSKIVIVIW